MTKIIQRHDTAANWTSINPILAQGEMGIETDTRKFKFGDGTTTWADLEYASSEGGGGTLNYDDLTNKPKVNGVELIGDKTSSFLKLEPEFSSNLPLNKYTQTKSNYINGSSDGSTITLSEIAYTDTSYKFKDAIGTTYKDDRIYPAKGVAYIPVSDSGNYWYGIYTNSTSSANFYTLAFVNVDNENGIKFLSLSRLPYSPSFPVTNKLVSGISSLSGSTYSFTTSDYNSATVSDTTKSKWVLIYIDKLNKQIIVSNAGTRTTLGGFDDAFFSNVNAILIGNYRDSTTSSATISSDSIFKKALSTSATGAEVVDAPDNLINIADFTTQNYMSLNVDNNTIKVNNSGQLEAITPANTITSDNIASDATIVGLNDAIEMAQGDIATLSASLDTKANADDLDGIWTAKQQVFLNSNELGVYNIDLSSYLPNDGKVYEILIKHSGYNNADAMSELNLTTSILPKNTAIGPMAGAVETFNTFAVPVGTDRKLEYSIEKQQPSGMLVEALAYRRTR